MYKSDIKYSLFGDENELKQEIKKSQQIEFEQIKKQGYESKNLINNYIRPFEDNSESLNISISENDYFDEDEEDYEDDEDGDNVSYKSSIKRTNNNNKDKPTIKKKIKR